jgi:hypothetical protein
MSNPVRSVETYYTLTEAVERFFPGGHITVRSLRTEIKKGRLRVSEVAGKFLVSESAIAEMLEISQPCRADKSHQGSISVDESPRAKTLGSSETERLELARDAVRMTIAELGKASPVTLPINTNRSVRLRRPNSTSTKS